MRCLGVARVLLRVVEDLYSRGYMHRDLKPVNILIRGDGSLSIEDFNVCYKMEEGIGPWEDGGGEDEDEVKGGGKGKWYAAGCVGTPLFVAPEVMTGEGRRVRRRESVGAPVHGH
jgi:serine/threonine protein kinase